MGSRVPIYRQVLDQIRQHLGSGVLSPGDALPSVRTLAAQLGVNFNTIAEAYRELSQDGLIALSQGKRAVVTASSRSPTQPGLLVGESNDLRHRLRLLLAEMRGKGISSTAIQAEICCFF